MGKFTTRCKFVWSLAPLVVAVAIVGCGEPDKRKPGRRLLEEKAAKLRQDMTVGEVDAVMADHPRKETRTEREKGSLLLQGGRIARASVLSVHYDDKRGADEGDYVLNAYFDSEGRLVGIEISEYVN